MSEETDLTVVDLETSLAPVESVNALAELVGEKGKYETDAVLAEVTKVGDWLPFIQLMGGESKEVKLGNFPIGHFCLRQNRALIDLGTSFVGVFLKWRPKAMKFGPPPTSVFDPNHPKFKEFETAADTRGIQGYGYGQEFLVWLPERKIFVTYFLGNTTGRSESPNITAIINDGKFVCEQRAEPIDDGNNVWHGPRTYEYDLEYDLPPAAKAADEIKKFKNPKAIEAPKSNTEGEVEKDSDNDDR